MFTAGSLFSGIGGIDLAASCAGFDIRWQVEVDSFCRKVLAKHAPQYWPNAKQYEDICHVTGNDPEAVDLMFGGFPCQDISTAGKRAGITRDTRSGLWFEFARLIGDLRPRTILLENVGNITHVGGTIVIGDLTGMGYDAVWLTVQAADVGASHRRERWFCIAYTNGGQSQPNHSIRQGISNQQRQHTIQEQTRWDIIQPSKRSSQGAVDYTCSTGYETVRSERQRQPLSAQPGINASGRPTERRLRGDDDGLPRRLDSIRPIAGPGQPQYEWEPAPLITKGVDPYRRARIKALGNAVVPQQVYPLLLGIREFLERMCDEQMT